MARESQIVARVRRVVPAAGQVNPSEPWEFIAQRHELYEDIMQLLTEQAGQAAVKLACTNPTSWRAPGSAAARPASARPRRSGSSSMAELLDWPWPDWFDAGA